ncbi:phosphotriesterase family protein [Pseudarthrobacter sp. O4]|uniref:phosphotriesterase family protein n=1 Tax=Pseudarthrobacter sp. O4 TaxID=3418417 RepID=UPI003CF9D9AA
MTRVQTVTGTIEHTELGLVLPHEHLANDLTGAYTPAPDQNIRELLEGPVTAELAWLLREHPYNSRDNCGLTDADAIVEDLRSFRSMGGRTVIDLTPPGLGRNPAALKAYSVAADVNVVMGSGSYLQKFQSPAELSASEEELTALIMEDFQRDGIKPGVIGEIGVSPLFTVAEEKSLRAAAQAQKTLGVPLFIHLPGWMRLGHRILDIVLDEIGVRPEAVVLCHMDPSFDDPQYQDELAARGAYLCFDMIGMPYNFASEGASPSPAQAADAIARLIEGSHHERIMLSHDVFLKGMLTRYGGNGFSYVPFAFPQRLLERGISVEHIAGIMRDNPAALFHNARTS